MAEYEIASKFNQKYSIVARKILHALSSDSRMSISDLSKYAGVSRRTVKSKMSRLEKEHGLRYTIELDEDKLGLTNAHLIMVKFNRKPEREKISAMLKKSYIPQFAVLTKGDFDMIIAANSFTSSEYAHWDKSMQIALSSEGISWNTSEIVHSQLGFYPARSETIEKLDIKDRYRKMLLALNENARVQFNELAKQLGTNASTIAYSLDKIIKAGYIKRFTITLDAPKDVSLTAFFSKYSPSKGYENSAAMARKAFMSDDRIPFISRFLICSALIGSHDFFTLSAYDSAESAYSHNIKYHKESFRSQGLKLSYAQADGVILGRLPIRSLDSAKEYKLLRWDAD